MLLALSTKPSSDSVITNLHNTSPMEPLYLTFPMRALNKVLVIIRACRAVILAITDGVMEGPGLALLLHSL
jgi:hypothetical protein